MRYRKSCVNSVGDLYDGYEIGFPPILCCETVITDMLHFANYRVPYSPNLGCIILKLEDAG
jgi:hypothetical protein